MAQHCLGDPPKGSNVLCPILSGEAPQTPQAGEDTLFLLIPQYSASSLLKLIQEKKWDSITWQLLTKIMPLYPIFVISVEIYFVSFPREASPTTPVREDSQPLSFTV